MLDRGESGATWRYQRTAAVVVAVAVLILALACVLEGARRIGRPVPGFLVSRNRIVSTLDLFVLPRDLTARLRGAKLIGLNGVPITDATEIDTRLAELPLGTPIAYRFRKGADVFTTVLPSVAFRSSDYVGLHGTFFLVAVCFVLGGLRASWRSRFLPAVSGFFWLCVTAGLFFATGGNAFGPYSLASLHLAAHCLLPAAALHFAASYPEPIGQGAAGRRWIVALTYMSFAIVAALVIYVADDPTLYRPFLSVVHLLLGNAILLFVVRITLAPGASEDAPSPRDRRAILAATLVAVLGLCAMVAGSMANGWMLLPMISFGLFALFPLLAAGPVSRARPPTRGARTTLHRLSVLFFDAVESTFLIGVVAYSFGQGWTELSHDLLLDQRRQERVESFLSGSLATAPERLDAIDALVETPREHSLVLRARTAIVGRDWPGARDAVGEVTRLGDEMRRGLETRQVWSGHVALMFVAASLLVGGVQTARFGLAVRRWLIRPINEILEATRAIGSGDLGYRVIPTEEEELGSLARSVNTMAASLREIQERIEDERAARRQAAGEARDTERRRVGRELHDSVLQDLGALKLLLEAEIRRPSPEGLQPVIDGIVAVITEVRRVVDDLRQPDLASISLGQAIADYARVRTHNEGVALQIDLRDATAVADWATRDVYRIAQEGITNAIRHGSPKELRIRLYRRQGEVALDVADDGCGFDLRRLTVGAGILGMRERAAALGGDLTILSAPGKGTTIQLTFPPKRTDPQNAGEIS